VGAGRPKFLWTFPPKILSYSCSPSLPPSPSLSIHKTTTYSSSPLNRALRGIAEPQEFISSHSVQILQYLEEEKRGKEVPFDHGPLLNRLTSPSEPLSLYPSFVGDRRDFRGFPLRSTGFHSSGNRTSSVGAPENGFIAWHLGQQERTACHGERQPGASSKELTKSNFSALLQSICKERETCQHFKPRRMTEGAEGPSLVEVIDKPCYCKCVTFYN
jgi:hypothetical protein